MENQRRENYIENENSMFSNLKEPSSISGFIDCSGILVQQGTMLRQLAYVFSLDVAL